MDPANPLDQVTQQNNEQVAPVQSKENMVPQSRVDELAAEKHALRAQMEAQQAQMAELTKALMQRASEPVQRPVEPTLPEGVDPSLAKFFMDREERLTKQLTAQTERMYWQSQHQMDQLAVQQKYANMPQEVRDDAARRLTGMKQQYGERATLDDAMKFAHYDWMMKQAQAGRAVQFNQMNPALQVQSHIPNIAGGVQQPGSTALVPPTQRADWDKLSNREQAKLIDAYEKAGGELI